MANSSLDHKIVFMLTQAGPHPSPIPNIFFLQSKRSQEFCCTVGGSFRTVITRENTLKLQNMNWQNQKCTCGDILHPLPVKTFSYYEAKIYYTRYQLKHLAITKQKMGTPIADVHVCKLCNVCKFVPYYAYNHAYGYVVIDTLYQVTVRTNM